VPGGPFIEPALTLAADPDAGPEEQRREILLACLAASPHQTLDTVEHTPEVASLLDRRDLLPALESSDASVRDRAFRVVVHVRLGRIHGPDVAPG